jgi:hypothetical protein
MKIINTFGKAKETLWSKYNPNNFAASFSNLSSVKTYNWMTKERKEQLTSEADFYLYR